VAILLSAVTAQAAPFAYIINYSSGTVSVIDTASNTVTATIPGIPHAFGVAVNPSGTRVYVTGTGNLYAIDTSPNTITATIPAVGPFTGGVAINSAGTRVYLVNGGISGSLSVVDTSSNAMVAAWAWARALLAWP